ncbi:MAG: MarR family transcriptional regulator [Chloroflexota bacterium]|nr:MarR family transcriptional regulator [Chloroflexota bacterium]
MTRRIDDEVALQAPIRFGESFRHQYPWAEKSATEAVVNLIRTADLLMERVAPLARKYGISASASNVLGILEGAGEPLPPQVISQRLFSHPATVTGLLDSLERRDLVRRTPHPTDRRKLLIELTDEGRAVHQALLPEILRAEIDWMGCLSQDEQEALVGLLGRIQTCLYELSKQDGEAR